MNNYTNPVTVTGNPASFEASGNGKLLSLSVPFSPIQDLHGYASPWPGGGGKNKLPSANSISSPSSLTVTNENGQYVLNGSVANGDSIYFRYDTITIENGFVFACGNSFVNAILYFLNGTTQVDYFTLSPVNRVINTSQMSTLYAKPFNSIRIRFSEDQTFTNAIFSPMVVIDGADTTTFAPYSNICPISGRTGLSVYVGPTQDQQDATTYAVDWTDEAGTVYGGTVDVVTGVLTVDRTSRVLDGTETGWQMNVNANHPGRTYAYNRNASLGDILTSNSIISSYVKSATFAGTDENSGIYVSSGYLWVRIPAMREMTAVADWTTYLSNNPLQVCYELATPITYQLTPTQVELLIGQNNVWSDSNEAVTLTYVIELFTRYTFIVNGNDYTGLVERDSYRTAVTPVYGETIQTLDGVGHTALLRVKGSLTVKLNPQTAAQTAAICADLLNAPCEVQYKCLQRNVNVTALMVLDVVSAMFLSRCLYLGQKWNDVDEIVLKEL